MFRRPTGPTHPRAVSQYNLGRMLLLPTLALLALSGWSQDQASSRAATITLVKDIFPGATGSSISEMLDFKGALYFFADDGTTGLELWKSDGTAAGTAIVKDINPAGAAVFGKIEDLNDALLCFAANDGTTGSELWISDGTAAGTTLLKDINPAGNSDPIIYEELNGVLYFSADDGTNGRELWKTDGTAAGTVMIKNINTSAGVGSIDPFSSTLLDYYNGMDRTISFNGSILFWANDGVNGAELWISNGTDAGTVILADIVSGGGSSFFNFFGNNVHDLGGGKWLFISGDGANDDLWLTDLTAAGTTKLKDFVGPNTGFVSISQLNADGQPISGPMFNNGVFFKADDGVAGVELWRTDGSATGTTLVKDIFPGTTSSNFSQLRSLGSKLLFVAENSPGNRELWSSDGTDAGTAVLLDINPGPGSNPQFLWIGAPDGKSAMSYNGSHYFTATNGTNGYELWKTDGTAAGTVLVKDINPGANDSFPGSLVMLNGKLLFSAWTDAEGTELWTSDGTGTGTTLVKDVYSGANGSNIFFNGFSQGIPVFFADDGINGSEIWTSDGTAVGTVLLKDINAGAASSFPNWLNLSADKLLFRATTVAEGTEGWVCDGTAAGTTILGDVQSGAGSPNWFSLENQQVGAKMFLSLDTPDRGVELYVISVPDLYNAPQIVSLLNVGGTVGTAFKYLVKVKSNPALDLDVTVTGLPAGLALDDETGLISGTPTTPGVYSVTLLADNGAGTDTEVLKITIPGSGTSGTGIDSDEDGFPDELETALGTDPNDADSGPFGGSKATPQVFTVSKLGIKLNRTKANSDSIQLGGTIPNIPAGFTLNGQTIVVDVGGVVASFTLDAKGKSPKGNNVAAVRISKTTAGWTAKFNKGAFADELLDEGLEDDDLKGEAVTVPVIVLFNSVMHSLDTNQVYNAKKGKGGRTTMAK